MAELTVRIGDKRVLSPPAREQAHTFTPIYERFFSSVYNYVRYRVQDVQLADDLTSEIFKRIFIHLESYSPKKSPFEAWMFAIARNVVNDHFRAQKRRKWISLDVLLNRADNTPSPEQAVIQQDQNMRLLAAVGQLERREQDLIALKFGAGLTNRAIAKLTGLTESNVGVIVFRAVKRLKGLLEREDVK